MIVDPKGNSKINSIAIEQTVEQFFTDLMDLSSLPVVHGILAAPPCTDFAASGARHWGNKDDKGSTFDSLVTVKTCLNIVTLLNPIWWALENPVGRLRRFMSNVLGEPRLIFDPSDYGDPYTKKTLIWGEFRVPEKTPVTPIYGSVMHRLPPGESRQELRSATPPGFAKAFFQANP